MSSFYNPRRTRNLFDPQARAPYKLSRSKLDLFLKCPRCFYLDRRLGVGQPPGPPFSLNSAVDALLKKEFDTHRALGAAHPLMTAHGIDAVPYAHDQLEAWRDSLGGGIQYFHEPTNLLITGGIDDVWVNPAGELHIVDYKATSKNGEVNLDADWQIGYKRQMEIYQWLFRKNNFPVHSMGYFVYVNGKTDRDGFGGKLEFEAKILPYEGDDRWVEETIAAAHRCLSSSEIPDSAPECDFCAYREAARRVER